MFCFSSEAEARRIAVAYPGYTAVLPVVAAVEKGYYKEEGLDVDLVFMRASLVSRALIAGNVDFVALGGGALTAIVGGAPLRILLTPNNRPMFYLYTKPQIKQITDLKDKKVAIGSVGSGADHLFMVALENHGLRPHRDVAVLSVGSTSERFSALVSGATDGAVLSFPFNFRAQELGLNELIAFPKQDLVELNGNIVTRETVLRLDPELVEKFIRASLKGLFYLRSNRPGSVSLIAKYQKINEDLASKFYNEILKPSLTEDGTVDTKSQMSGLDPALKIVKVEKPPPLDTIFSYELTRKIARELRAKNWQPGK
jgi:NitT/TauT family transport system substrate-binding protein